MKLDCADVLTLITGNLFVPVDRLYQIYNGMTGDTLFTHQLPRAFRACAPIARERWPEIAAMMDRLVIGPDNYLAILERAREDWGDEFMGEPLSGWKHIDPLTELGQMVPPEKIICVETSLDAPQAPPPSTGQRTEGA